MRRLWGEKRGERGGESGERKQQHNTTNIMCHEWV